MTSNITNNNHNNTNSNYNSTATSRTNPAKEQELQVSVEVNINDMRHDELPAINFQEDKFPYCIVWTPIPVLTWILPMIGHMGICDSNGTIRDFAGPYFVSEGNMAFGRPTRYLRLNLKYVEGGRSAYDDAVSKASVKYGTRMHIIFWDNCHSHVGTALEYMRYKKSNKKYNMIMLAFWMFFCGKYVGIGGAIKTWLPFFIFVFIITIFCFFL